MSVEGELVITEISDSGRGATTGDSGQIRGQEATGTLVLSDERLSGEAGIETNLDPHSTRTGDTASISWGDMRVTNPGGDWRYTWTGGADSGSTDEMIAYGHGEGDHEGWSVRFRLVVRGGMTGIYDVRGVAFEGGDLPPTP